MTTSGKVALVTGGASGIGLEVATLWAAAGHRVVIADIAAERGAAVATRMGQQGGFVRFVQADLSSETDCTRLFDSIAETEGRLDLALNNAGIAGPAARIGDVAPEAWRQALELNLFGVFRCLAAELRLFSAQRQGGCAINVSSVYGKRGVAGGSAYAAAKHAILGLTRSAALEYGQAGIRVNAVCPGFIETPFTVAANSVVPTKVLEAQTRRTAARRLGHPREVAQAINWLASDAASFINGAAIDIDGGFLAA